MFGLIERVTIPALVIFVLLGALIWRSDAALRFVRRMNRWSRSA